MHAEFYPSDEYESDGPSYATGHASTYDVLSDSLMHREEKRALLASWASDLHAVENWPALRRLDDGTVLHIDAILNALKALDRSPCADEQRSNVWKLPRYRKAHGSKHGRPDDDDDPPPAPVATRLPKPRPLLDATTLSLRANRRHSDLVA